MIGVLVRLRPLLALLRSQTGQAMAEYSTITFLLLTGTVVGGFAVDFPGQHVSLAQALYSAIQTYVDSFYYSLQLLAP